MAALSFGKGMSRAEVKVFSDGGLFKSLPSLTKFPVQWTFSRSSGVLNCPLDSKRYHLSAGQGCLLGGPDSCYLVRLGKGTGTQHLPLVCSWEVKTAVHPLLVT